MKKLYTTLAMLLALGASLAHAHTTDPEFLPPDEHACYVLPPEGDALTVADTPAPTPQQLYQLGYQDAADNHGRRFGNGCLGYFFGIWGVAGALCGQAKPWKGQNAILSHNQQYFKDPSYRKGYAKRARKRATTNAGVGLGARLVVVFMVLLL